MALPTVDEVLAGESAHRDEAWRTFRAAFGSGAGGSDSAFGSGAGGSDAELAELVLDDPSEHPWRLVDAALARLRCEACGSELGGGARGCGPCDRADGWRFGAREPDRPAVPPGNEHAVRVALTIVRFPHRWPPEAVEGARLYLPRLAAGDLPTKAERYALLGAVRRGRAGEMADARTFTGMAARAEGRRPSGAPDGAVSGSS